MISKITVTLIEGGLYKKGGTDPRYTDIMDKLEGVFGLSPQVSWTDNTITIEFNEGYKIQCPECNHKFYVPDFTDYTTCPDCEFSEDVYAFFQVEN